MSRISDLIAAIRTAVYGEQVRGAIADSIQECYDDVSTAKTLADDAASRANTAADEAENVNITQSKTGSVVTITTTDRDGVRVTTTISDREYVAPIEISPTALAYAVGEFLIYNGVLYEVMKAISVGGTLTPGTNIKAVPDGLGNAIYTYVTPLMFGAKGDGVTDDTAAFQAALNSGYNEVFVPTSHGEKYIITDTLTIPNTCKRIFGEGLPRGSSTYGAVWFIVPDTGTITEQRNKPLFAIGNTEAFGFYGLHFHCAPTSGSNRVGTFLDATSTYCDKDINVYNMWISNFYTQFNFRGRGLTVVNSTLSSASNVAILNWDDENDSQRSSHPATMGQRAIRFQNNRIHSIQSDFWHIQSGHAYGMVIQNNVIDHGQGKIIRAADEAWNWNISGNLFQCIDGYTSGGLTMNAMVAFYKGAKNCVIDSNVFSADPTYWENGKVPDGWITVSEGYNLKCCTITGNTFKDYGLRGIWLTGAEGSTITGNTFETSIEGATAAIVVRGAQVNTAITGNTLKGGSEGAFMLLDETATFTGCEIGHNAHDGAVAAEERGALMQYVREMSPLSTATGASISVTDAAPLDAETLTVAIVPTQAGSGDPAPDNIRAISGITGATVTINSSDLEYEFPEEAGTVYHGTLNVLTGVLTVDYAIVTLRNDDRSVVMDAGSYTQFYFLLGSYARKIGGSTVYCTHYKTVYPTTSNAWKTQDDVVTFSNSALSSKNGRLFLRDTTYNSVAALKEFWEAQYNNGTPVQIAYPLATPLTFQLPIRQITMLRGANTVVCDDGDVTLKYRIDAAWAMEKAETAYQSLSTIIGPVEDAIASTAYQTGGLFIHDGALYKTTASIASGDAIVPGTNCTQTTIIDVMMGDNL